MNEPKQQDKPFQISKWKVWEAYERVKANKGAAGVDEQSITEFEADRDRNLYKIWNRMSSGSYFPPPVKAVEIPKAGGKGVRLLGVPTVADRVAQTVARLYLEPQVEPVFHLRLLRLPAGQVGAGRGRGMPETVLAGGLGDRYGHPGVLRHRALGPRAQGGRPSHLTGPEVDLAVCGAVAQSATPARRWHPGGPGSRDPAGVSDLTVDRQPVHALRVESAGINRHGVEDERALHRRSSEPRWPRVMRWRPVREQRSVDRGTCRPGYGAAKCASSGCRRRNAERKATSAAALVREPLADPARSENHGMHGNSVRENREVPCSPVGVITRRAAQGTLRR